MASITIQSNGGASASDISAASVETQDNILLAQAAVLVAEQVHNAASLLNERGYSTGITSKSVVAKSPRNISGSRGLYITFDGDRPNGKKSKRNAEVAFLNEYGVRGRMSSRGFIRKANEAKADECANIASDLFAQYVADQITF